MALPDKMLMSHQLGVEEVSSVLRKGRYFKLSKMERYRAIHALFRINTGKFMFRAIWIIRVLTEGGGSFTFQWCPRKDPMEAPL